MVDLKLRPCLHLTGGGFLKPQCLDAYLMRFLFLQCGVSLWLKGELKMPVNCKLAYDWLGAIKFLSNHFWFRKYSAILETSNIYFCLIYFTFSFIDNLFVCSHMGTKQSPFLCSWREYIFGYTVSVYCNLLPILSKCYFSFTILKMIHFQCVNIKELRLCY